MHPPVLSSRKFGTFMRAGHGPRNIYVFHSFRQMRADGLDRRAYSRRCVIAWEVFRKLVKLVEMRIDLAT